MERLVDEDPLEIAELPGGAPDVQLAVAVDDRDPGAVVAAVLELAKPLDQDLDGVLRSDVSDDPAHATSPSAPKAV